MKIYKLFFYFALWGGLSIALFVSVLYLRLPNINELRNIKYQEPLRIFTVDGALISQIGNVKRTPVAYEETPTDLINALISAEDSRFFQHIGLDPRGLARAVFQLITRSSTQTGGSTITMQVARNYYLTRDRTIMRKLNEILLAIKMERALSKQDIMSLYVNTIFLGYKSFGMAAAAKTYYNLELSELSLAQYAMLAALPKAPSKLNPVSNPKRAQERRDWILMRMAKLGYISRGQYLSAVEEEISGKPYDYATEVEGLYVSETARLAILNDPDKYGVNSDEMLTAGYKVYTSVDKKLQQYANVAVRSGLLAYDKRHGWRGAERQFEGLVQTEDFFAENPVYVESLKELATISSYDNSLEPSIVKQVGEQSIIVVLSSGDEINISWDGLSWAAPYISEEEIGDQPELASDIVSVGDMVRLSDNEEGEGFRISQIPRAEGALLAVNPNNGMIAAMVGGYHFQLTKYNRAVQARRQIGSAIKPFLYAAALSLGYNGADIFNDAPLVSGASGNFVWRPTNAGSRFLGYIPLREGLYRSRNLISVRLLRELGVNRVRSFMTKFGLPEKHLPNDLSLSLGSAELTLLEVTRAYGVLANGGYLVEPNFIDRIESADGKILYESAAIQTPKQEELSEECVICQNKELQEILSEEELAVLGCGRCSRKVADKFSEGGYDEDKITRVISPQEYYQINSILRDVVQRGTAIRAKDLGRLDLAGKTGTTQDFIDAWFVGYNPDLVAVSWVGFDSPSSLGPIEYGSIAALPIWKSFMKKALRSVPEKHFAVPEGLVATEISISSEGTTREFTEYINIEHINEYIERIKKSAVFVDYYYNFLDTENLDINPDISTESNITRNNEKRQEVQKLF